MKKQLKRFGYVGVVLGMIVMTNAQWAILQTVAWSGMLISYTARSGLETGIRETFDGEHPCPLCTVIQEAKSNEQATEKLNAYVLPVRLLAVTVPVLAASTSPNNYQRVRLPLITAVDRILDPPPVPPPRARAA